MKVIVLGSGVIGTTTAYFLAKSGHEVTVIERQAGAGRETSFANAGQVSPGYSAPWAGPGVPVKAIKWLLMQHRPLVMRPWRDIAMLRWGAMMLQNCTEARYRINKSRMVRLAEYSRDCMIALREETGISYDERALGTLQVFRTQKQLDDIGKDVEILRGYRVPFEVLDREGICRHEPALALVKDKFAGALRLPGDETGDCFKFTQAMHQRAADLGVQFLFDTKIKKLDSVAGQITGVQTCQGTLRADRYLVCLGSYSPVLVKPLSIDIPVYPVKGYSITVPIDDPRFAPQSTVMDETHKIALTRLGKRIRVGGTAELAGFDMRLSEARRRTLSYVASDLFPKGGDTSRADFWCGLRPMTPDGTPVLGGTRIPNLYLSTGHGTLGWTMAAGSARILDDLISNRSAGIDMEGLTIDRYKGSWL